MNSPKHNPLVHFYDKHYKQLTIIPIAVLVLCLIIIGVKFAMTGDIIERDVTLKGGATITITSSAQVDLHELRSSLQKKFPDLSIETKQLGQVGAQTGFIIEVDAVEKETIDAISSEISNNVGGLSKEQYNVEIIGSSLGESFFQEAIFAVLIAFVFMAIVVMIYFRDFFPATYIVFAAFADIVMPFTVMVLFDIKLSTAGIAAFLMLIGYSVDTDILLTSRVLRAREGSVFERIMSALPTGVTMTITALAVTLIGFFLSEAQTLKQIMLILSLGLCFDLINTWLTNAGMLRWHLENKEKKRHNG